MKINLLKRYNIAGFLVLMCWFSSCTLSQNTKLKSITTSSITVKSSQVFHQEINLTGSFTKKIIINLDNLNNYGSLSIYSNDVLLVDNLNIPKSGNQVLNTLVNFDTLENVKFTLEVRDTEIVVNQITFQDIEGLNIPKYEDISVKAGLDKVNSIKYGGPTIADIDQDGDYDFIVNNHNAESSKLYWNNGDGTVTKHSKNLARWFMHDLHGTAAGDFDNDGDLDLVVTQGGGNGISPSKVNFYKNESSNLIRFTGDVDIDRGGRGRGARWSDLDLDGDLDLILINESGLKKEKPQHFFYENLGNSTFAFRSVGAIQNNHQSRALITDLNGDNIDDIIFYSPLSIWLGNGDFTFTNITKKTLQNLPEFNEIMAVADIDIDNDGDLDLYLARGKEFENGLGESPSLDSNPLTKEISIKSRGFKGVDEFSFVAKGNIKLHHYYYLAQGVFRGKDYPIYLGEHKKANLVSSGGEIEIDSLTANGWPKDISKNGLYFGYLGNNKWKAALVRNGNIFWQYRFSLKGVTDIDPKFIPQNRNVPDVLLRNDNGVFTDVSKKWNLQTGGNSLGVTVGDFNNDSFQDIFVFRWGFIGSRIADYMLLNTGKENFETVTMHGAHDIGGPGNGDMGQAFDFDLDGDIDLLNGSEGGEWYLYANNASKKGNFLLVDVGYAPISNVDAISAEVIVNTPQNEYRKRVGSSGEVFSQSLLNIVHFGLGNAEKIESVQVRWRNGETILINENSINSLIDTDNINPKKINILEPNYKVRKGTSMQIVAKIKPTNANKNIIWSSSDSSILKVDSIGVVHAIGKSGQSATISAKSKANGLSSSRKIKIIDWYSIPLESVAINKSSHNLIAGQQIKLSATITPDNADNSNLVWSSSNKNVATVNNKGLITSLKEGETTIKVHANSKNKLFDEIKLTVQPLIQPFIKILNKEKFNVLNIGDSLKVEVEFHAGSGKKVIHADEGGIRIWLRFFKSEWIPIKDVILIDEKVIKTETGKTSKTFSLKDLIPTSKLSKGHFYMLRATFTSSDGNMYEDNLYPLNIEDKN